MKTSKILNKILLSLLFATSFVSTSYTWNFNFKKSETLTKKDFNSYKDASIIDVLDDIIDYTNTNYSEKLKKELPRDLKFIEHKIKSGEVVTLDALEKAHSIRSYGDIESEIYNVIKKEYSKQFELLEKEVIKNKEQISQLLEKYPNDRNLYFALELSERSLIRLEEMKSRLLE